MKFSEQWLREWVNPELDTQALCDQLSMAGLEVDSVEPAAPDFDHVVVAKVLSVDAHPDADKLRVCKVDGGDGVSVQIVCGASNVTAGMKVPLAKLGAVLPGGMKIKQAKLRGVESSGMLCSAVEIGMAEEADGLMPLPEDAPIGTDIREYLGLNDNIIDIDLTPNRGDCLSIIGVAREVAALNGIALVNRKIDAVKARHDETLSVAIKDEQDCSRYVGRIIKGLDTNATSPQWMVERLRRAEIRSIHPVVDVTNLVMLELGQPMHAFDLAKLSGGVQVRRAQNGETLKALTEEMLSLSADDLVIADDNGPIALAGVMGGLDSGVTALTQDILLESACFHPLAVAGTGRRHKLHTDSSHRFERGVDPELQEKAIERATSLIVEICGGQAGSLLSAGKGAGKRAPITLRSARINRLLGFEVPADQVVTILKSLFMKVEPDGDGQWQVTAPGFRYDIRIEADLIEEVVRIYGYEQLPDRPQQVALPAMESSEKKLAVTRLREAMIHRGYQEVVTYSFVDPDKQAALIPDIEAIDLDNPIARQLGQMRTSLWPGLLEALNHNIKRQQQRLRLFEIGMRFESRAEEIFQTRVLGGLVYGNEYVEQWAEKGRQSDFYAVKSDLEALLSLGGEQRKIRFEATSHVALHPGISAAINVNGNAIGSLGSIHPKYLKLFDLDNPVFLFELDLDALCQVEVPSYESMSEFPATRRDLALVMPESVSADDLITCTTASDIALLNNAFVFDVYRGEALPSGCKSVALGLIFQDKSRTLTEQEVDASVIRIQERLSQELGANIRG